MARKSDGLPPGMRPFNTWTMGDIVEAEERGTPLPPEVQEELRRMTKIVGSRMSNLFPGGAAVSLDKIKKAVAPSGSGFIVNPSLNAQEFLSSPPEKRWTKNDTWWSLSLTVALVGLVIAIIL